MIERRVDFVDTDRPIDDLLLFCIFYVYNNMHLGYVSFISESGEGRFKSYLKGQRYFQAGY